MSKPKKKRLNWKRAAVKLKTVLDDLGIDNYFKRQRAMKLRDRYNDKERTQNLYNEINEL